MAFIDQAREAFITEHMKVCTTKPAKKYDPKKPTDALHSVGYTRRKCAKSIWRRKLKK